LGSLQKRVNIKVVAFGQARRREYSQEREGYKELGGNYFDERDRQTTEKRLVRRLEKLGYEVSVKAPSPAA